MILRLKTQCMIGSWYSFNILSNHKRVVLAPIVPFCVSCPNRGSRWITSTQLERLCAPIDFVMDDCFCGNYLSMALGALRPPNRTDFVHQLHFDIDSFLCEISKRKNREKDTCLYSILKISFILYKY